MYCQDHPFHGGGVLIAIHSSFSSSLLNQFSDGFDFLSVKLLSPLSLVICSVYIPPSANSLKWSLLIDHLQSLHNHNSGKLLIIGDFNCPDIDWNTLTANSSLSTGLCEFIFDHNLTQLFPLISRVTSST